MLQIYKLLEKSTFINKTSWPLQIHNSYTLTNSKIATVSKQKCWILISYRDAQFWNLMQHRKLIQPSNNCSHRKNTQTILVASIRSVSIVRIVRSLWNSCTYFLVFSFFYDHINPHDRLLESFYTSS